MAEENTRTRPLHLGKGQNKELHSAEEEEEDD